MSRTNRPGLAIGLILITYLLFSLVDALTKNVADQLPPVQAVWMRYLVHCLLTIAIFAPRHGRKLVVTSRPRLNILRGIIATGSSMGFIYAALHLPLPVTTAVQFVNPLLVCVLSAIFLSEHVGWRRFSAIIVGMVGVAVVLRPHGEVELAGLIGAAVTVLCLSTFAVITRALTASTAAYTQQTYASFIPLILLTPFAISIWDGGISAAVIGQIGLMGIFAWTGYYLMVVAHQYAQAVTLAPFVYTMLLWTSLASWIAFDQPPDRWVVFGSLLIIASGLYIWHRERQLNTSP